MKHPTSFSGAVHGAWLVVAALTACGGGSSSSPPAAAAADALAPTPAVAAATAPAVAEPAPADLAAAASQASETLQATTTTWSPEALEDLLAPVALYPDPVLVQLLVAVTNPQEVLDAGNWLIANPDVSGKQQDQAAEKAGFTLPMRAVMQFPEVVDQLCLNMPWTEELGQAYVNDQQGVMDAVQRLRAQAQDVGNLKTSPQMQVSSTRPSAAEPEVISIAPPPSQVVYVPQYDPQAVYAPPGTTVTTTTTTTAGAPPGTATTTESTSAQQSGHSTGSLVATGLLAFGAGMLVNEIFDDDDDWYRPSYYGPMWHRPMPYYPPYPYRPVYGPGFYPSHGYVRPPTYARGGNTVVINQHNDYFNRYDNAGNVARTRNAPRSPITAARPNRPELQQLNAHAARGPVRSAPAASEAWKGRSGYAGTDPKVRQSLDRQAASAERAQASRPVSRDTPRAAAGKPAAPKIQGSYAGARPTREPASGGGERVARDPPSRPEPGQARSDRQQARPAAATQASRPVARDPGAAPRSAGAGVDRGRPAIADGTARPSPQLASQQARAPTALSQHGQSGHSAQLSSQRGKQSLPAGHAKARAGGGRHR